MDVDDGGVSVAVALDTKHAGELQENDKVSTSI